MDGVKISKKRFTWKYLINKSIISAFNHAFMSFHPALCNGIKRGME